MKQPVLRHASTSPEFQKFLETFFAELGVQLKLQLKLVEVCLFVCSAHFVQKYEVPAAIS